MCSADDVRECNKYVNHGTTIGYRSTVSYSPVSRGIGIEPMYSR